MSTSGREQTASLEGIVTRAVVGATILVSRGPDAGTTVKLEEPSFTIGKGPTCALRLTDQTVSREHLRLELSPEGLVVHDGGSKNGTWLGGVRVKEVTLTGDASLKLGATAIDVSLAGKTELVLAEEETFGAAFAQSVVMRHVFAKLLQAAPTELSVLLEGESGVGKEVLARAIHDASARRRGPFVPIDCGAIPPDLMESELFGHGRGAFTGAQQARIGLFQQADGGTVFLDELGELPIDLQPKLLRVLEQREVRPVGDNRAYPIDVRIIAATNRNLKERMAERQFREDLYFRVAMLRVRVPSLRERPEDVAPLATRFLREISGDPRAAIAPDILAILASYRWPGNVRELRNVVGRVALLDARDRRELFDVTGTMRRDAHAAPTEDLSTLPYYEARRLVLERLDATYFPAVLERAGGVAANAAKRAGLARSTFYKLVDRRGEPPREDR